MRMALLRILNITILRNQHISDWFKQVIVDRLMNKRNIGPFTLERTITINNHEMKIEDRIDFNQHARINRDGDIDIHACRRISGTHMASARYFQHHEMDSEVGKWMEKISSKIPLQHSYIIPLR